MVEEEGVEHGGGAGAAEVEADDLEEVDDGRGEGEGEERGEVGGDPVEEGGEVDLGGRVLPQRVEVAGDQRQQRGGGGQRAGEQPGDKGEGGFLQQVQLWQQVRMVPVQQHRNLGFRKSKTQ